MDLERTMMELGGRCKGLLEVVYDVCYIVVPYCLWVAADVTAQIREDSTTRYLSQGRRTPRQSGLEHCSFSGFNRIAWLWQWLYPKEDQTRFGLVRPDTRD